MDFKQIQRDMHQIALEKGWYDPPKTNVEAVCLMHAELSEAVEELRKSPLFSPYALFYHVGKERKTYDLTEIAERRLKPEGFGVELADCVIRIMDTCEWLGIDLESLILLKAAYNKTRPFRHGGKSA